MKRATRIFAHLPPRCRPVFIRRQFACEPDPELVRMDDRTERKQMIANINQLIAQKHRLENDLCKSNTLLWKRSTGRVLTEEEKIVEANLIEAHRMHRAEDIKAKILDLRACMKILGDAFAQMMEDHDRAVRKEASQQEEREREMSELMVRRNSLSDQLKKLEMLDLQNDESIMTK